jgi:hypothetical protein
LGFGCKHVEIMEPWKKQVSLKLDIYFFHGGDSPVTDEHNLKGELMPRKRKVASTSQQDKNALVRQRSEVLRTLRPGRARLDKALRSCRREAVVHQLHDRQRHHIDPSLSDFEGFEVYDLITFEAAGPEEFIPTHIVTSTLHGDFDFDLSDEDDDVAWTPVVAKSDLDEVSEYYGGTGFRMLATA